MYTSPAKPTVTTLAKASYHPVGGKTLQRMVRVAPVQLFGAKIVYTNIYGGSQVLAQAFGRGPGLDLGPVMVSAIVSHGLTALRPLYNSQEGIAITVENSNFNL